MGTASSIVRSDSPFDLLLATVILPSAVLPSPRPAPTIHSSFGPIVNRRLPSLYVGALPGRFECVYAPCASFAQRNLHHQFPSPVEFLPQIKISSLIFTSAAFEVHRLNFEESPCYYPLGYCTRSSTFHSKSLERSQEGISVYLDPPAP